MHVECSKKDQCYKKNSGLAPVKNNNNGCPNIENAKPIVNTVHDEVFIDKNKRELTILDEIERALREIVGLQSPPNSCANAENSCRPGALTEDQFADFLKTQFELTKKTCHEPNADDKCKVHKKKKKKKKTCPGDEEEKDPEDKLTEEEIQNVLKKRCQVIAKPDEVDPPKLKISKQNQQEGKLPNVQQLPITPPKFVQDPPSQGIWQVIPHKHSQSRPLDGSRMYRELSTPAFSHYDQNTAQNIPKYSSLFQ